MNGNRKSFLLLLRCMALDAFSEKQNYDVTQIMYLWGWKDKTFPKVYKKIVDSFCIDILHRSHQYSLTDVNLMQYLLST